MHRRYVITIEIDASSEAASDPVPRDAAFSAPDLPALAQLLSAAWRLADADTDDDPIVERVLGLDY